MTKQLKIRTILTQWFAPLTLFGMAVFLVPVFAQGQTVAVDDSAITSPGAPVTIDVLTNDNPGSGTWDLSKVKSLDPPPANGTLQYNQTDGTFIYTPNAGVISLVDSDYLPLPAYTFNYEACDNGGSCASAVVSIVVAYEADLNIIPKKLNVKKMGVIPVKIGGVEGLDITMIDPYSLMLEGVAPVRSNMPGGKKLTLKFKAQDIVRDLQSVPDRLPVILQFTGATLNGEAIFGEDSVIILNKSKGNNK